MRTGCPKQINQNSTYRETLNLTAKGREQIQSPARGNCQRTQYEHPRTTHETSTDYPETRDMGA